MTKTWTDAELQKHLGLTSDEIAFIESMVHPMEANGEDAAGEEEDDE